MPAQLLEGKVVAQAVLDDVRVKTQELTAKGIAPGLGTLLVGEDPASAGYVRKKHEMCEELGIASVDRRLPSDATQEDLLSVVRELNENPEVDAFLIQHPVPKALDFNEALRSVDPAKDADGLHPFNLGKLVLQEAGLVPCTPAGIQALLVHYDIPVQGREVVILGRGPTLGRPLALLMSQKAKGADAAVTVVHSRVPNLAEHTRRAEILIAAVGYPSVVTPDMVAPGAVVISGGISWEGKRLVPDVDESVAEVAGWITPRLGGVGPTTIAMLMRNTVEACIARRG